MDKLRSGKFTEARYTLPKSMFSKDQITELCNFMVASGVISENVMMEIKCETTPQEMMTKLMQILSGGGNSAYDQFRIGLEKIKAPQHLIDLLPEFPSETSTSHTVREIYRRRNENTPTKEISGACSRQRLAISVQRQATSLGKVPRSSLQLYELPMKTKYADENKRIRRLTSGGPHNSFDTKTVIMFGIYGSGKSLLINHLVNLLYGVEYGDEFRFKLILEEKEKSEREEEGTTAMTSWVTTYEFIHEQGFPMHFNFNLTLIDTPGFADDKGVSFDEIIVERIKDTFQSREIFPEEKLNAVGFVIPASTTRLTAEQKYVFDQILNIFGKNLKEKLTVLCTFADAQVPPAIEAIEKDVMPVTTHFKFNNSAVFAPNDDDNKEETECAWRFGHKNVTKFLEALRNLESRNLDITNDVLDEQESSKLLWQKLKLQIDMGMDELKHMSSGEIRRLPLDVMKELMKSDIVNTQNAEAAFRLLIMWTDSDRSNRLEHLHSLMEQKIGLLPSEFLLNVLTNEEVVSSTNSTLKLVTSTLRVKQLASSPFCNSSPASPVSSLSPYSATGQSNQSDQDTLLVLTSVFKERGKGIHEKFDPDSNTWSEWTTRDMGTAYRVAVVGEWMAVIGGMTPTEYKSNIQIYNLRTKEWKAGPQMNHPRSHFGCCVMNGDTIVVCGGTTTNRIDFAECEMLKLDPNGTGTWEQLPRMTSKRCGCSAASINKKIFVVGGQLDVNKGLDTVYSTVEEFDVTTKNWSTRSSMNEARMVFATATHQNMIYVFGGLRHEENLSSCERYDPSTDKWQYICNLPSPRHAYTAGLMGNKIYIIGGIDIKGKLTKTTYIFDTEIDSFIEGPNLNNAAHFPKCVVVKKHFLFN